MELLIVQMNVLQESTSFNILISVSNVKLHVLNVNLKRLNVPAVNFLELKNIFYKINAYTGAQTDTPGIILLLNAICATYFSTVI